MMVSGSGPLVRRVRHPIAVGLMPVQPQDRCQFNRRMLWRSSEVLGNTAENVLYLKAAGWYPLDAWRYCESLLHLIMNIFLHAAQSHIYWLRVMLTLGFPG
jgi:hypothetical protein